MAKRAKKAPADTVWKGPDTLRDLLIPLDSIALDDRNPNTHDAEDIEAKALALDTYGQQIPLVLRSDEDVLIAGEGRTIAARTLGWTHIAVLRSDLEGWKRDGFMVADNETGKRSRLDPNAAAAIIESVGNEGGDPAALALSQNSLDAIALALAPDKPPKAETAPRALVAAEQAQRKWNVQIGDIWAVGPHRIMCGDCRSAKDVAALLDGRKVDVLVSDPPYNSGGYQEAGRAAGSWGEIASDSLSSRGHAALLRDMLEASRPPAAYMFSDWRQWSNLYDVVESAGLGVKSMIVWDKGSPGMGGIWRTQHELVIFASRSKAKRAKGMPARGNVITATRTGNTLHYTQKPVEVMRAILEGDQSAGRKGLVYDPFAGSASTIVAAHELERPACGMEVEPSIVAVILERLQGLGLEPQKQA